MIDLRCDYDATRHRHMRAHVHTQQVQLQKQLNERTDHQQFFNRAGSAANQLTTIELTPVLSEKKIREIQRGRLNAEVKGDTELNRQCNL